MPPGKRRFYALISLLADLRMSDTTKQKTIGGLANTPGIQEHAQLLSEIL